MGLKKISRIRGSKVFADFKNGQKKCPIFEFGGILGLKNPRFLGLLALCLEFLIFR